ncbi:hypothetical protein [Geothrix oryzisoli]|uniref:hypothetical protein n=1 Tax=Geothrix oryzisoli TaxID=2922721 RepID=UPI001FAB84E2|nr:hypothetical protein [Geothrix oryzisoli]
MKVALIIIAILMGLAGLYQFMDATLGRGSGLLATVSIMGACGILTMALVLERLDKIAAKL